jgi:hypothetical protein
MGGHRKLHEFTSSGLTHSFVHVTKLYTQEHMDKYYGCDANNSLVHYEQFDVEDMSIFDPPRDIFIRSYFFYYLHKLYMVIRLSPENLPSQIMHTYLYLFYGGIVGKLPCLFPIPRALPRNA